jgi:hypothetical protein
MEYNYRQAMHIRESIEQLRYLPGAPEEISPNEEVISVSSATGRVAHAYEQFRNTLEPDEADILRRKAIARILERRLAEDRPIAVSATALLQELIRAHYIKAVSTHYVQMVSPLLGQARLVHERLEEDRRAWFLGIMAVALDRLLFPRAQQEGLVHLMYHDSYRRVAWADFSVSEADRPAQLYIACHRALFAADNFEIIYHYFLNHFPWWKEGGMSDEQLAQVLRELPGFYATMKGLIHHPIRDRLLRVMRPVAVPYRIVWELMQSHPQAFADEAALELAAREVVSAQVARIQKRLNARAWHSILFLFFTKTLLALLVELPYELLILANPHWLALGVNIAFHPLLLFFLGTSVRLPGASNTDKIVEQVKKIVSGEGELPTVIVSAPRQYGAVTWSFFAVIYAALFLAIFWGLFSVLATLQFSLLAMMFFVVFLGLVSFLSVRIRRSVDDIRLLPKSEGAFSAVFSFLFLPVLEFGRFLTQNISQLNVILFVMDRVLEAPFKLLIDIIEEWFAFVRDRREEIV